MYNYNVTYALWSDGGPELKNAKSLLSLGSSPAPCTGPHSWGSGSGCRGMFPRVPLGSALFFGISTASNRVLTITALVPVHAGPKRPELGPSGDEVMSRALTE